MSDLKGVGYLRRKLDTKIPRVLERYKYYEMKKIFQDPGPVIPAELRSRFSSTLGWCAKAVDSLTDRLVFREFEDDNFDLGGIYDMNNPDTLFDSAILSALISSCCFIYISPDSSGFPRLQVIDGGNATGIIDPVTGLLQEGYAVLERDRDTGRPILEAYFAPYHTDYYIDGGTIPSYAIDHRVTYPLLVPIIYRPDVARPFGHSRISRSCMYLQKYACNVLIRSEISAEFYSFPQKYLLGTSQEQEQLGVWRATISSFLQLERDSDGNAPTAGQFTQQSMTPYIDQLKTAASLFSGETGLTMDDLGFSTENPSSAEAIKATHEDLRMAARKAQRCFGSGLLNAGYLAACLRDNVPYERKALYRTKAKWEPIFEPDAAMLSGVGDALIKIQQGFPNYLTEDKLRDLVGF